MPIYFVKNEQNGDGVAVKANNKAQALNFVVSDTFSAEAMTAEDVMSYMEGGAAVKDATTSKGNPEPCAVPVPDMPTPDPSGAVEDGIFEDDRTAGAKLESAEA